MKGPRQKCRTLALLPAFPWGISALARAFYICGFALGAIGSGAADCRLSSKIAPSRPRFFESVICSEAQYTYKIGPTIAGRRQTCGRSSGRCRVQAGQVLGEMEPVDFDDRVVFDRKQPRMAEAAKPWRSRRRSWRCQHAKENAATLSNRYEQLFQSGGLSEEEIEGRRLEYQVAEANHAFARANLDAARQDVERNRSDRDGLLRQRANLKLVAPVDGLVVSRNADPGTTVIAGQAVVEIIDPNSLWINVRFDQLASAGLHSGLAACFALRSRSKSGINGRVLRGTAGRCRDRGNFCPKLCSILRRNPYHPSASWRAEATVKNRPRFDARAYRAERQSVEGADVAILRSPADHDGDPRRCGGARGVRAISTVRCRSSKGLRRVSW